MAQTTRAMLAAAMLATAAATPDVKVAYVYPSQAAAFAPLKAWFDRQAAALRTSVAAQAAADKREAVAAGRPFNGYESDRTWKVVTDTPRFLSLSLERFDSTDGAHGGTGYAGLVWDRQRRLRIPPLDFFASKDALRAAIRPAFCAALDRERAAKRGGAVGNGGAADTVCIDPLAEALILGSTDRQHFTRLGVLVAPYDAGPYAEGTYEVTLPVTPAVIAAVRPEFRGYFAVGTP